MHSTKKQVSQSYKAAVRMANAKKWSRAMGFGIVSLKKLKTQGLVRLPKTKLQLKPDGLMMTRTTERKIYFARSTDSLQKGTQKFRSADRRQVFVSVLGHTAVRLVFADAVVQNYSRPLTDVKNAFVNAFPENTVCIVQPEGFVTFEIGKYSYCLNKALYGLKKPSCGG